MDNGQFDKIREKLHDVQMPVDADIWSGIESSLLRRKRMRRLFYYASTAAAILIAALFVHIPSEKITHTTGLVAQQTEETSSRQVSTPGTGAVTPFNPAGQADAATHASKATQKAAAQAATAISDAAKQETAKQEAAKQVTADAGNIRPATAGTQKPADAPTAEVAEKAAPQAADSAFDGYLAEETGRAGKQHSVSFSSSVLPGSSASVAGSFIRATSAGAGNLTQSYSVEQISDTKYSLPLNLGIQFQLPLGENIALGIGANYTMLRSRYDCLINKKRYNVKQTLHYIGIPVNIYGLVVDKNNFSFYVNAGGALEKGIKAVYQLKSYDSSERNTSDIDGLQFSLNAGMGVEYRVSNTVGLYLEPNIVYYFNSDIPRSIRTDQPLQVKAELGFRFRF